MNNNTPRRITLYLAVLGFLLSALVPLPSHASQPSDSLRAVLITGTSSGIGLRMTEVLSQNGYFVYAGARDAADLQRLNTMANVQSVRLDVTKQDEIDAAVTFIKSQGRGLYALINNAGVAVMGPLIEMPEEELYFQLNVNLMGPYRVTKAFADLLIESEGRILNVSSIAGIIASPYSGAYSMSKHGLEAYTDALAAEMGRFNVTVAAVEPGNYKSQILASMVKRMKESGYSAEESRYGSMLDLLTGPLDRSQYKEPDEVAYAALDFLSSETPKKRYMVTPNQAEAEATIRQVITELVQLNEDQPYAYDADQLHAMLSQALGVEYNSGETITEAASSMGIHEAAMRGNVAALNKLITSGVDLNEKEQMGGSTPLIIATTFGQPDAARTLIEAGADINLPNNDGSTPLLVAALFCRTDIVATLLTHEADKEIRNNAGSLPMDVVTIPFEDLKSTYDYLATALGPYGLKLDYERIRKTRPLIAAMLE